MGASSTVTGAARPAYPHRTLRSRPAVDDGALRVVAERQRIAGRLHDEMSPLLFGISSGAHRAELRDDADVAELREALRRVGEQVEQAADVLRAVLRDSAPVDPVDGVPAAAHRDVQDFIARSGLAACLRVRGAARSLAPAAERVVLSCLRLALCNVEHHAGAASVVVTLDYGPDRVALDVRDDGRGLPAGFELSPVPAAGRRWGLASVARQVEQLGGAVTVDGGAGGGTRLRVHLPG